MGPWTQLIDVRSAWRVPAVYAHVNPPGYPDDWLAPDRHPTAFLCLVAQFVLTRQLPGGNLSPLILPAWGPDPSREAAADAVIPLDALQCHEWMIDPTARRKEQYQRAYEHHGGARWTPQPDAVHLDPETFLPLPEVAAPSEAAAPVLPADPPLRQSIAAADRLMRQLVP